MGQYTMWRFISSHWAKPLPVATRDLSGQTVVVLGANVGLGFEAAKHFSRMNAGKVILACRSKSKGEEALSVLKKETGYQRAELWIVDLADFASVRAFADKFDREESRLDILVANAAVGNFTYEGTKDGYEASVQVNHLSTALLSILLYPKMASTYTQFHAGRTDGVSPSKPRIVIVASGVHYWVKFDETAVNSENLIEKIASEEYCTPKIMAERYMHSKLLNVFYTRALAAHTPSPAPVTVLNVCPGYCYSSLRRQFKGVRAFFDHLMELALARTTEVGSRQLVWAALESKNAGGDENKMHGEYIYTNDFLEVSDYVLEHPEIQERIWDETIRILSKVEPRVTDISRQYFSTPIST